MNNVQLFMILGAIHYYGGGHGASLFFNVLAFLSFIVDRLIAMEQSNEPNR